MEMGDPVVSSPQGKPIYRDPSSLLDLAGRAIATTPSVVQHALDIGLPSKIISIVFSTAVRSLVSGYHRGLRESVVSMTSRWPCEKLSIVDQVGQEMGTAALTGTSGTLLIEWLMEGLLTTRSTSRLRELDLSGYTVSNMFLVPLLWLPPEERTVDVLLKEIHSKYSEYLTEDDSNIEEILTWKVNQLTDSSLHGRFEGTGKVDIRVDCQANVSEWVSVCDEVLGIMVSGRTPFNLLVHKLSVNNYQSRQAPRIKWLLSMIDTTSLKRLGLYGYRKSVDEALHIFHGHFKHLPNLTWFAWATCGPKVLKRPIDDDNPSQMEILVRGADVFHSWSNLTEGCFHGVLLTDMLAVLLNALPNALRCLYLVSNELSIRDVDYLAWSHHLDNLRDLTIEKNNLEKMGQYVAELTHNATSLKFLSLKDTNLLESDKMEIMLALQDALILQTFVFFDTHSMLSTEGYLFIIESACHIKTLRNFYIFPFNHEPFEKFQREHVYKACMEIIMKNDRKDLSLAY